MKDHIYKLQNAFSSLHDWLLRAAELSETDFHPGSWSGPGSMSAVPSQRTTGRSPPESEPILALEDESHYSLISTQWQSAQRNCNDQVQLRARAIGHVRRLAQSSVSIFHPLAHLLSLSYTGLAEL
ncbi:hypothetical protein CF319_g7164 [Tilletia indica]|nr:hypothetical protein CF319_g7164 [Tilletia indica]